MATYNLYIRSPVEKKFRREKFKSALVNDLLKKHYEGKNDILPK